MGIGLDVFSMQFPTTKQLDAAVGRMATSIRLEKGLTPAEVAQRCRDRGVLNIHPSCITAFERGSKPWTLANVRVLCAGLGIKPSDFVYRMHSVLVDAGI